MRAVSFLMGGMAVAVGVTSVSCGNGDDVASPPAKSPAGIDASMDLDATGAGDVASGEPGPGEEEASSETGTTPTLALLRLANWSADSPGIDFCLAPHGTGAFRRPFLATRASAIDDAGVVDAGSGALLFPQATAYLVVDPAQYDARVVAAGSVDCSTGITKDATNLPALASGGLETIALVGAANPQHGEPGLEFVGFLDELKNSRQDALLVRVINAAADLPKAEVGTPNKYDSPFLSPVSFGDSSAGDPAADPNGYIALLPFVNQTIVVRASVTTLLDASAHTIVAQASNVSLPGNNTVTLVVIGANVRGGGSGIAQLLACIDNAGTVGLAGACQVISQ